jgi:hypothetical protein
MTATPGTLEERLRAKVWTTNRAGSLLPSHEPPSIHIEAADEIASLRARVEAMREACARIAERDADRSNAVFEAGIGGDAGKDRNAARYRTALRIARAIRDAPG